MLKVYNTLSRKKETFKPRKNKKVNLFVCGPTVYDYSHIGHARTYIIFDVIVKYLRQKGFNVFYLQNITDIDDKIIKRAKERKTTPLKLARQFEREYLRDTKALKIDSVTKYARATDYIKEIISQVKRLLEKGYAYKIKDGIYYDIKKFKDYGKLSRRTVAQAEDGVSRIDESKEKKNKGDFCLWKLAPHRTRSGAGFSGPSWKSPWGDGRPGWHIEDTAITEKHFGPQYDAHGGAKDLIFPHHEAEIAQMEAISGKKPLVNYWIHSGFLTVRGRKMAKSFGNFITIRDFLKENPPRLLRLLILKSHYRSPIDYNEKLVAQTKKELEKIDEFTSKLKMTEASPQQAMIKEINLFSSSVYTSLEDDFNTPKAIAVIFDLVSKGNSLIAKNKLTKSEAKKILEFLKKVDKVFNFIFWEKPKEKIPQSVRELVKKREEMRKKGKWQESDKLREKIKKMGYWVEDTKERPKVKKI